jgi:hypothetical protein
LHETEDGAKAAGLAARARDLSKDHRVLVDDVYIDERFERILWALPPIKMEFINE